MTTQKGQRFLTYSLRVELNLTEEKSGASRRLKVKLVFSKSLKFPNRFTSTASFPWVIPWQKSVKKNYLSS